MVCLSAGYDKIAWDTVGFAAVFAMLALLSWGPRLWEKQRPMEAARAVFTAEEL